MVNSFHKGISYGYRFVRKGKEAICMDMRQYPDVDKIEKIYQEYSGITRQVNNTFNSNLPTKDL